MPTKPNEMVIPIAASAVVASTPGGRTKSPRITSMTTAAAAKEPIADAMTAAAWLPWWWNRQRLPPNQPAAAVVQATLVKRT